MCGSFVISHSARTGAIFDPNKVKKELCQFDRSLWGSPPDSKGLHPRQVWESKQLGWFGGATIGLPTADIVSYGESVYEKLSSLHSRVTNGENALELNRLYLEVTSACRKNTLAMMGLNSDYDVILETNGTTALKMACSLLGIKDGDELATTFEQGNYVSAVLSGADPWQYNKGMFRPVLSIYEGTIPEGNQRINTICHKVELFDSDRARSDDEILQSFSELADRPKLKAVVVPHVTKGGRILPVARISEELKSKGVRYIVDGIQAFGRLGIEELRSAAQCCDYYAVTFSKALGSVLVRAGLVARRDTIEKDQVISSDSKLFSITPKHFQFSGGYSVIDKLYIDKLYPVQKYTNQNQEAISLPETACAVAATNRYLKSDRLATMLQVVEMGNEVVNLLKKHLGARILYEDVPHTPAIISFSPKGNPEYLKKALQSMCVTPSANVAERGLGGKMMRFEIAEHLLFQSSKRLELLESALQSLKFFNR